MENGTIPNDTEMDENDRFISHENALWFIYRMLAEEQEVEIRPVNLRYQH